MTWPVRAPRRMESTSPSSRPAQMPRSLVSPTPVPRSSAIVANQPASLIDGSENDLNTTPSAVPGAASPSLTTRRPVFAAGAPTPGPDAQMLRPVPSGSVSV